MDSAKIKIRNYTEAYKTVAPFKTEYEAFVTGQKQKISLNTRGGLNKHAKVEAGRGVTERLLTEIPETLFGLLYRQLEPEEWMWFSTVEGKTWYANTYKEFSATGGKL